MPRTHDAVAVAVLLSIALAGHAQVRAIGLGLTPMGAEVAGNPAGTIPSWTGGLTSAPEGFRDAAHYPDPYAADQPLFVIDASNLERHADKLTEGQVALLKRYPTWKMRVFPSRRSASFPEGHYRETAANRGDKVKLAAGGNGVEGTDGGIPFPVPTDGLQVIWNHLLRYRGDTLKMAWNQAAVTRSGDYEPVRLEHEFDFHYGNLEKESAKRVNGKLLNFLQKVTKPARLAGQILLVHEFVDQVANPRNAWQYNPGARRVRLAPDVAYDNPAQHTDGLRTNDDFLMFNGATDRYDWRLMGKREIYVPYNAYALFGKDVTHSQILLPGHINPALARYELHRVWVVEATLKPGVSHIYGRRVFFVDEDSWNVLVSDKYDSRGALWRVAEMHTLNLYDVPMLFPALDVHHDLLSGRYVAAGFRGTEEDKGKPFYERIKRTEANFTPDALRGLGTR